METRETQLLFIKVCKLGASPGHQPSSLSLYPAALILAYGDSLLCGTFLIGPLVTSLAESNPFGTMELCSDYLTVYSNGAHSWRQVTMTLELRRQSDINVGGFGEFIHHTGSQILFQNPSLRSRTAPHHTCEC